MKTILGIILGIILIIINFAVAVYFFFGSILAEIACNEAGKTTCPEADLIAGVPLTLAFLILIFFLVGLKIKLFKYLFWVLAISSPIGLAVAVARGWF